jgi:hypothetical protein
MDHTHTRVTGTSDLAYVISGPFRIDVRAGCFRDAALADVPCPAALQRSQLLVQCRNKVNNVKFSNHGALAGGARV